MHYQEKEKLLQIKILIHKKIYKKKRITYHNIIHNFKIKEIKIGYNIINLN